tara:strand:+ start:404 stop:748 length:345 start_codon:yes stop_codon:yes gene_type:complete
MEELTMKQLEERQEQERAELRLQLSKKQLKETKEKLDYQKKEMLSHVRWLKEIAQNIIEKDGKLKYEDRDRLQQQTEIVTGWITAVLGTEYENKTLNKNAKELRKQIKNRKENK